jgi:hypothetical protein
MVRPGSFLPGPFGRDGTAGPVVSRAATQHVRVQGNAVLAVILTIRHIHPASLPEIATVGEGRRMQGGAVLQLPFQNPHSNGIAVDGR